MHVPADDRASDTEWRQVLTGVPFGQLITVGCRWPLVAPLHFAYDGDQTILCHLSRRNPVLAALEEDARCVLAVIADYMFIPGSWNLGVPTSYYAAVQARGRARLVDDHDELSALLAGQLALLSRDEPGDPAAGCAPDPAPYLARLGGIRGIHVTVDEVRAKAKFGGNRSAVQRAEIADRLAARGSPEDLKAREWVLRRALR